MRIVFFIESLLSGGKERRIVELIKGLSKNPNNKMLLVLTKKDIHYKDIFSTNVKIKYLIRERKKDYKIFIKFYHLVKKFKPNVINVWGHMVALYAIPTKVLLNIPIVNNEITDARKINLISSISYKITFYFSDRIISNSIEGLMAYDAPENKSSVVYNGFDFERIMHMEDGDLIRKRFNINSKYVVAMIASFTKYKDYSTYINAAKEVLSSNKNVTFLCVGEGDTNSYKKLIKKNDKILFIGKQHDVESIMNICDIGVLISNSNIHGEGISNSLLEFMAIGKPVIANDCGGNKELIENNENGFIIKDNDFVNLKDKILLLLNNEKLKNRFGNRSKKIVINKFSIYQMIDKFSFIFSNIGK